MQSNQIEQQKCKNTVESTTNPWKYKSSQKLAKFSFSSNHPYSYQKDNKLSKSEKYHSKKWTIILSSYTIIYPHTMMIKILHTSI